MSATMPFTNAEIEWVRIVLRFGETVKMLSWKQKLDQRDGKRLFRITRCATKGSTTTYKMRSGRGTVLQISVTHSGG